MDELASNLKEDMSNLLISMLILPQMQIKSRDFFRFILLFGCLTISLVVVAQPPNPAFDADVKEGCEGTSLFVQFSDLSSGNPTAWLWDFGDGTATSNLRNPVHSYTDEGRYAVTLTATNGDGSQTVTVNDFIVIHPTPVIDFQQDQTEGCVPLDVNFQFNLTANSTPITDYQWVFTNGDFADTDDPTIQFSQGGSVGLVLTVEDALGCRNAQSFDDVGYLIFPCSRAYFYG